MSYDWSQFRLRIPINAGVDEIYRRWSNTAGLTSWFLREALFYNNEGVERSATDPVRPGDSYLWRWFGYGDDVQEKGSILSANHSDELEFSFGKAGKVRVKVYTEANTTVCELEQYEIPTDEEGKQYYHVGCSKGWVFYLANLKSILESGTDLRNKDEMMKEVISS
ncbi:MAG: hypothetical protein K0Q66_682 [Chitinophagaceae bacterium]|jgi:hypothetical protein|nr:hypothetical protein [Chitinophagaceae bacterium]